MITNGASDAFNDALQFSGFFRHVIILILRAFMYESDRVGDKCWNVTSGNIKG